MTKKTVHIKDNHILCKACDKDEYIKQNPGAEVNLRAEVHTCNFIYRPPEHVGMPLGQNVTMGVKFCQGIRLLDPWGFALLGKNRWQRFLFKLLHPIIYSDRCLRKLYRRIKGIFVKEKPVLMRRAWISKEEALKNWPKDKENK